MLTSSSNSFSETTDAATDGNPAAEEGQEPGRNRAVVLTAEVAYQRSPAVVLTPGRWAIGSRDSNQIVVDHEAVAPRHAMIIVTEHRVLMTSWSNATYVNGDRCRESLLCAGDVLTVGTVDISLRAADSAELISQLPDVSADQDRQAVIHPVSADETLRQLDDLDTALGLLDDELGGEEDAVDQLNELIDRIEDDMTRRSERQAEDVVVDARVQDPGNETADTEFAEAAPNADAEPATAESFQPMSLDALMRNVNPDDAEARKEHDIESVEEQFFDDAATEYADEEHPSETEEIAQLVGSTSVLAQNLTVNALRSRAEAVRQLDEMILAAAGPDAPQDTAGSSGNGPAGPPESDLPGTGRELPDDPEFRADETELQSGKTVDDWKLDAASPDNNWTEESPVEASTSDDSLSVEGDAETETAADDTVEFSAMDTVNEAGSLLSSLFHDEPNSEEPAAAETSESPEQATESDALPYQEIESAALQADKPDASPTNDVDTAAADFDTVTEFDAATELDAAEPASKPQLEEDSDRIPADSPAASANENLSGVRSRLAEMFDMPSLTSATPRSFDTKNPESADRPNAGLSDEEPHGDSSTTNENADEFPSRSSGMILTSWLDGMRDRDSASEPTSVTDDREHEHEPVEEPAAAESVSNAAVATTDDAENAPEDSVAAYMKDLLARNRARHGQQGQPEDYVVMPFSDSSTSSDSAAPGENTEPASAEETVDVHDATDPNWQEGDGEETQSWLSQGPKHQLDKDRVRAETQTLREVANATARSAVSKASRRQLKVQVAVKSIASIAMLGCGVAASVLGVSAMFTFLALGVGAFFAFDLALTIARNWKSIQA